MRNYECGMRNYKRGNQKRKADLITREITNSEFRIPN